MWSYLNKEGLLQRVVAVQVYYLIGQEEFKVVIADTVKDLQ